MVFARTSIINPNKAGAIEVLKHEQILQELITKQTK
jgi:hypothetical protein